MGGVNVACQDCDWTGTESQCKEIDDFHERVSAGEIMPYGQCPECGALCHAEAPDYVPTTLYLSAADHVRTGKTKTFAMELCHEPSSLKIALPGLYVGFVVCINNYDGVPSLAVFSDPKQTAATIRMDLRGGKKKKRG